MKTRVAFAVFCSGTLVLASSVGTVPRSAAAQYSAHATSEGVSIGAVKLNQQEVLQNLYFGLEPMLHSLGSGNFP
jgi:hypothetical protein